jgi:hypothetical protein
MRIFVGAAFVAGVLSSALWYEPGKLEMKAAMIGALGCGFAAAVLAIALIAVLRLRR